MPSRNPIAVIAALSITIGACGGASEPSADEDRSTSPPPQVITKSTSDIESATVAPEPPVPTTSESPVLTTSEAVEVTAPVETVVPQPGECPNGNWRIDPAGIGPFDMFGSSDDITLSSEGSFVAVFADGRYSITAEEFSLDLLTSTSDIGMTVTGSTSGTLAVGVETLTFIETSFDMTADVTIAGEEVPGEFIAEAFHQTFGSATVPYTCNADGTVTITYDTPTGPATAVHEPV